MTPIDAPLHDVAALIDRAHEAAQEPPRPHLGCSMLGHPCERWLWLSFRWAVVEQFDGRILRLFRRGQNEESIVLADLAAIGCEIASTDGKQARVDFGAHVSGSIDGIIESGVPGATKTRHVLEIKTHGKKSFDELDKAGVRKAKWQHFVQMQLYMHGTGCTRALYFAVCKDNDAIYTERVEYDKAIAESAIKRGHGVTLADRMPPPLSTDPTWYQCRWCPAHSFCHKQEPTRQVNCRTCAHATAKPDSTWHCSRWEAAIPTDAQREGCADHVLHPDMVPWPMQGSDDGLSATYIIDGVAVRNGHGGTDSRKIVAHAS